MWTEADTNDDMASAYSESKTKAEQAAWAYAKELNIELATIHPALILGALQPGQRPTSTVKMLLALIDGTAKAAGGVTKSAFGLVSTQDVVDAHIAAMLQPAAAGERYLLTSNDQFSSMEVAQMAHELFPRVQTIALTWRDAADKDFVAKKPSSSNKKACALLGVAELTPPKQAVQQMVQSFIDQGLVKEE